MDEVKLIGLAAALGVGLLIGGERERSHGGDGTAPAGVRTFTLASLLGALAGLYEEPWPLVAFGLVIGALAALAYRRSAEDPGLTTEIALVVAYLLGALAMRAATLAAAIAVVVTVLLVSRTWLHDLLRNRLSGRELSDALLLAAAALVVLPLIPDRTIDPWGALNLRLVWTLAVLFMAINGLGYVALRALGAERGLPLAGLAAGFVSSAATHSAMGARARAQPEFAGAAVAGAALSSLATVVQLALIVGVTNAELLRRLALPLAAAGAVALGYGGFYTWRTLRNPGAHAPPPGRAFDPRMALGFALAMSAVILLSALLVRWLGARGAIAGAALVGFADTHAAAVSAASLARSGAIPLESAAWALLAGFSSNAVTKAALAAWAGGAGFAARLVPGLLLMVAAAWSTLLLVR